jgi:hypothetical protein
MLDFIVKLLCQMGWSGGAEEGGMERETGSAPAKEGFHGPCMFYLSTVTAVYFLL